VLDSEVGFIGGNVPNVSYRQVCSGDTGHAEAVHLHYDPAVVSYEQLLDVFWDNHNPCQVGGQGVNLGEQYRSAIFVHSEEQRAIAEASLAQRQRRYEKPITTVIQAAGDFVRAEEYHQQYYEKQGRSGLFR